MYYLSWLLAKAVECIEGLTRVGIGWGVRTLRFRKEYHDV